MKLKNMTPAEVNQIINDTMQSRILDRARDMGRFAARFSQYDHQMTLLGHVAAFTSTLRAGAVSYSNLSHVFHEAYGEELQRMKDCNERPYL